MWNIWIHICFILYVTFALKNYFYLTIDIGFSNT